MLLSVTALLGLLSLGSCMYSSGDGVVELDSAIFPNRVQRGDGVWFVEFYAPWCGHCQSLAPEWKKAAKALKGVVNVAAVNCDDKERAGSLCGQFGIRGFPTIKVFGLDKNKPEDYQGPRQAQGIVDAAMQHARKLVDAQFSGKSGGGGGSSGGGSGGGGGAGGPSLVVDLGDSDLEKTIQGSKDMWLVEFYAPWCGHCKNLKPHWDSASKELKGESIKLAAVDATVHTVMAQKYGVNGFPTIKFFEAGDKRKGDLKNYMEDFDGGRSHAAIVSWARERLAELADPPNLQEIQGFPTIKFFPAGAKDSGDLKDYMSEYDGGRTSGDIVRWAQEKLADTAEPPEVKQIVDQSNMKEACDEHQLCVIAVLPHILDCNAQCRNEYIDRLKAMGEKYKKRKWGWLWSEAGSQPKLEESIGMEPGFMYPGMVAVNVRKGKYAMMRGAFSETGINDFLRDLAYGRGSTAPIKGGSLPEAVKIDAWDGKDGKLPEVEDIDVSDVKLDDEL